MGGGGANAPLPSGIRSFADPKALPRTILEYPFLLTEPKILRGERAPKKRDFLVKIIQKVPENAFFGLLFQKIACGTKKTSIYIIKKHKIGVYFCFVAE